MWDGKSSWPDVYAAGSNKAIHCGQSIYAKGKNTIYVAETEAIILQVLCLQVNYISVNMAGKVQGQT